MAVSPLSITHEVPSITALATSLASARVGSGASLMLSSICVAVITSLPAWPAAVMMRFCSSGTRATPASTPRSPRATMTASVASTMASRLSIADSVSILAMMRIPVPPMILRSSSMSSA